MEKEKKVGKLFQPGNKQALGNRGGGRKGFEWERDQVKQMKSQMNWMLAYVDAVRKGKNTPMMDKQFQTLEKVLLKMMDKLHANKQETDITSGGEKITPIYGGESIQEYNSDQESL